ncbi:hypothetical protein ACODG7_04680 [Vibrio anguillarum]|uniref:hypothetical protein n=1 Tax=Vibrio anguillarum TaxID=55601 RepID=UPI00030CDA66|nr:hypothetical protein [Vibrio anguillarum]OEE40813.1 hypothetical protein A1QW_03610 [Vibrio anguillarum]OEF89224.1 hypothetical protein A1QY_05035 [Vibrio anguillarum]
MYRRYRLEEQGLSKVLKEDVPTNRYAKIKQELEEKKEKITTGLEEAYVHGFGYDADALQESWFPVVKGAHTFISHSHADKELAANLAIWLKHHFDIDAFIDSHIWGYALDLQKNIDEKHCKNEDGATYSYEKRNFSTSHVHLMLANSLTRMLNECECLIFLETSNSLLDVDEDSDLTDTSITASPWIMHELSTSGVLRENPKIKRRALDLEAYATESYDMILEKASSRDFSAFYKLDLETLRQITRDDLSNWSTSTSEKGFKALTSLYNIKGDHLVDADNQKVRE